MLRSIALMSLTLIALTAGAAELDITSLLPGYRFGMTSKEIAATGTESKRTLLETGRTSGFMYKKVTSPNSPTPLEAKFYMERPKGSGEWRLTGLTLVNDRDEDRDALLVEWHRFLTGVLGTPVKTDDSGSGLGGRSPTVSYFYCKANGRIQIEAGRIQQLAFLKFQESGPAGSKYCAPSSSPQPNNAGQQASAADAMKDKNYQFFAKCFAAAAQVGQSQDEPLLLVDSRLIYEKLDARRDVLQISRQQQQDFLDDIAERNASESRMNGGVGQYLADLARCRDAGLLPNFMSRPK